MPETWRKVEVSDRLKKLEAPFLADVEKVLKQYAGEDEETFWYLSWRLELASIDRNLVDQSRVRNLLFEQQGGRCPECGNSLGSAKGNDVHKRLRMFARHQGYTPGNVVLLHRRCHEQVHQREPHAT